MCGIRQTGNLVLPFHENEPIYLVFDPQINVRI